MVLPFRDTPPFEAHFPPDSPTADCISDLPILVTLGVSVPFGAVGTVCSLQVLITNDDYLQIHLFYAIHRTRFADQTIPTRPVDHFTFPSTTTRTPIPLHTGLRVPFPTAPFDIIHSNLPIALEQGHTIVPER